MWVVRALHFNKILAVDVEQFNVVALHGQQDKTTVGVTETHTIQQNLH